MTSTEAPRGEAATTHRPPVVPRSGSARPAAPRIPVQKRRPAQIPVAVYAEDVILQTGVVQQLRQRPEVELLSEDEAGRAEVSLLVVDALTEAVAENLRRLRLATSGRIGLVVGQFEAGGLQTIVECGVAAVLRRSEADQDRLVHLVTALANGEGVMPGDLLGELLDRIGMLQRTMLDGRGLTLSTLTARETEMLRLVAEGFDTSEIAAKTSYSERTVKNVLHEIITRLRLRNRAHAVGYAMRRGLI
ncbi:response regulator transcription factor [Kitasatospora aureofaciens]|uniref:Helix-turn-helix transcriptional regulator n=1 Tax=Kitasatospora aureofaciens TaxID=1894 RepID=A0A1E7MVU1_KITAU|nr:LuxR C-terminal-related transcriptional regulator [Kitasatospora aureofaciens]OEV32557.1 helix-turn-helix transcriptional regulator [Kitasatospora aureofaciens]QEU98410.1 DNA-binding response regulator [Streptomyces viridifaciens]UKZ04337.1 LuxR C-terminal-related transcriptional regulator [Streptomyces viridifaciens]GGV06722.1 helix-turn-helix transcriptional regulator [Kitasatospora aureofaciens]